MTLSITVHGDFLDADPEKMPAVVRALLPLNVQGYDLKCINSSTYDFAAMSATVIGEYYAPPGAEKEIQ